ncbi:MAG: hypothetical protein GX265_03275 [Mollicutes bacterium]|nr:hypothetical protein [Mollicutes bacterium]
MEKEKFNKELLIKLNEELKTVQDQIKAHRFESFKIGCIRNLKIIRSIAKYLLPFIITGSIITGGICLLGGGFPFHKDKKKYYEKYCKEIDSNHQTSITCSYDENNGFENKNLVIVYGNWKKREDGKYYREMENYRFEEGEIKEEEIIKVVSNKNFDISSLLGQPTKIIQTKDSIFPEEIKSDDYRYIQAFISGTNKENYIIGLESNSRNLGITLIELMLIMLYSGVLMLIKPYDDIRCEISNIICDNKSQVDMSVLRKQLVIRRENIKRLTQY